MGRGKVRGKKEKERRHHQANPGKLDGHQSALRRKDFFPLFLLMVLAVILVVIFPEIALWMPEQMIKNIN